MSRNHILLAIDDSEASERAARYVGSLVSTGDSTIWLLNVLPPLPSEFRVVDSMSVEKVKQLKPQPARAQRQWTEDRSKEAHPALDRMRRVLLEAGVSEGRTKLDYYSPRPGETVPDALLAIAADCGCSTIAVGHHSLPWHREQLRTRVGEQLVQHMDERTIWVIG